MDNVIDFRAAKGAGGVPSAQVAVGRSQSQSSDIEVSGGDPFLKLLVAELLQSSPWLSLDAKSSLLRIDWGCFASAMVKKGSHAEVNIDEWQRVGAQALPSLPLAWFGNQIRLFRAQLPEESPQDESDCLDVVADDSLQSLLWSSFIEIGAKAAALLNEWPQTLVTRYSYTQDQTESRRAAFLVEHLGKEKTVCKIRIRPSEDLPGIFRTDIATPAFTRSNRQLSSPARIVQALRHHVRIRHQLWRCLVGVYRQPSSQWPAALVEALTGEAFAALQHSTADVLGTRLPGDMVFAPQVVEPQRPMAWGPLSQRLSTNVTCSLVALLDGSDAPKSEPASRLNPTRGRGRGGQIAMPILTLLSILSDAVGELAQESRYSRLSLDSIVGKEVASTLTERKGELLGTIRAAQVQIHREIGRQSLPGGPVADFAEQVASLVIESPLLCMLSSGILRTYGSAEGKFKGLCLGTAVLAGEIGLRTMGALPLDYFGSSEESQDRDDAGGTEDSTSGGGEG